MRRKHSGYKTLLYGFILCGGYRLCYKRQLLCFFPPCCRNHWVHGPYHVEHKQTKKILCCEIMAKYWQQFYYLTSIFCDPIHSNILSKKIQYTHCKKTASLISLGETRPWRIKYKHHWYKHDIISFFLTMNSVT